MVGVHNDKSGIRAPIHSLAASNENACKPAAIGLIVDWQHELEQSQQRRAANDATLKELDKELEVKIAKLKAETGIEKEAILEKIASEDRVRLKQLLAGLKSSSNPVVGNSRGPEEQDVRNFETVKATARISPDNDDRYGMTYEQNALQNGLEMETQEMYPYQYAIFHNESNSAYQRYQELNDLRSRGRSAWD